MKCFQCKKEIDLEFEEYIDIDDLDVVCSTKCAEEYRKEKEEFFNNIADDVWYTRWMEEL